MSRVYLSCDHHLVVLTLLIGTLLHVSDIPLEFARIDPLLKPFQTQLVSLSQIKKNEPGLTYISSTSAGVRRVTSGRTNQATITASVPVPAKLLVREKCQYTDRCIFA